jgi:hypothetical protein
MTPLLSRESCRILTSNRRRTARVVRHTNGPEPTSRYSLPADLGSVYPDRRPQTRARVKEARLSFPQVPTVLPPRTLIVEERLRLTLSSLRCLRRLATLADEPHGVQLFADMQGFSRVVRSFTRAIEAHVGAVSDALPAHCTNLDAPERKAIRSIDSSIGDGNG